MTLRVSRRARLAAATAFAAILGGAATAFALDSDPDPTFDGPGGSGNGKFTMPITAGDANDNANDVAIQEDGKIVVAGSTDTIVGPGSDHDFALARFNTDGTLDNGFGGDGIVTTKVAGDQDDFVIDLAIQDDGKIVVAGGADVDAATAIDNFDFAIARYHADGTLDTDNDGENGIHLDHDGIFITSVGSATNGEEEADGVAIQSDGKIVAAGPTEQASGTNDFGLVRLKPADGSLDETFDGDDVTPGNGKVTTDFAGGGDNANAIAIQSDDKIVVAGEVDADPNPLDANRDFGLARYNPAGGTLDTGFDADGKVTTSLSAGSGADSAYGLTVQPSDGKLVAVGQTASFGGGDFGIARYNPGDGGLDAGFDGDGVAITPFNNSFAVAVAIQADGKIVAAGREDVDPSGSSNYDFALTRYNADGGLDPTFSADGILTDSLAPVPSVEAFTGVAVDGGGKILAVGTSTISGAALDWALARYGFEPPTVTPPPPPLATPSTATFNLAAAIKRCRKKFPKGPKRKKCIKKAKRRAAAT